MSHQGPRQRIKHDPFSRSIRYLKENSYAMQAYLEALKSARHWASQGEGAWSKAWEQHARNIANAGPKWSSIRKPYCTHPHGTFDTVGRVRVGRKSHSRNPAYMGVTIRGGSHYIETLWAEREERERDSRRRQEERLVAYAKAVAEKAKKKGGTRD